MHYRDLVLVATCFVFGTLGSTTGIHAHGSDEGWDADTAQVTRDKNGNVTNLVWDTNGDGIPERTVALTYDDAGNLMDENVDQNGDGAIDVWRGWGFDDAGNCAGFSVTWRISENGRRKEDYYVDEQGSCPSHGSDLGHLPPEAGLTSEKECYSESGRYTGASEESDEDCWLVEEDDSFDEEDYY